MGRWFSKVDFMDEMVRLGLLGLISFGSGMIDLSLGMGYGFTVTPLMLLLGFTPIEAVPCVLFSSFVGGAASSFFNHRMHNVDFSWNTRASRVSVFTALVGIIGSFAGVQMSFNLPQRSVGLYIGLLVIVSGVLVLASKDLVSDFSWFKMSIISLIGSINKGLTGSGFGPVITTGAMLAGIDEKESVSIQSLSEASVSLVGFLTYLFMHKSILYSAVIVMSVGVFIASPIAARVIHRLEGNLMRNMVGVLALIIGTNTLYKYW
jgi:uncharacterized membrane protein YfcA